MEMRVIPTVGKGAEEEESKTKQVISEKLE